MSTDQLSPLVADLHLLTVLAATKSFTETARRLATSKASVSMRISELERQALDKQLKDLLSRGLIQPSKSPCKH